MFCNISIVMSLYKPYIAGATITKNKTTAVAFMAKIIKLNGDIDGKIFSENSLTCTVCGDI